VLAQKDKIICQFLVQIPMKYLHRDFFMMVHDYRNIGRLAATHGVAGELVLEHRLGKKTSLKGLEVIFVEDRKEEMLPWFIAATKIKSDTEVILKLDQVDSREAAKKLVPKEVWITLEAFQKFAGSSAPISFVGYQLMQENKSLGEIIQVIEQPHQVLCTLQINGKEVLIPLHAETLHRIDKKKKQVHVVLPDGLLEVYLGNGE
jgi:16S rRNA processing protein RimM